MVIAGRFAFIPALMFLIVWLTGTRNETGAFGGKGWWYWNRPIHGIVLLLFAFAASSGYSKSWLILAFDSVLAAAFYQTKTI